MTSFTSYVTHRFFWAPPNLQHDKSQRRGFFSIEKDKILYLYEDKTDPGDRNLIQSSYDEVKFLSNYFLTYNRHWLSTFNRPTPAIPFIIMNDNNAITKWVNSDSYFWICAPKDNTENNNQGRLSRIIGSIKNGNNCQQ
eukprot:827298_1